MVMAASSSGPDKLLKHPHQRLIVMPDDGVQPLVDLIVKANKEIRLKQFKLESSEVVEALLKARAKGVDVKVMLNPHTSGGLRYNDQSFEVLSKGQVSVAWTSKEFPVTHEKSMVIDRSEALIATFNLSDKYFTQTRDYGVVTSSSVIIDEVVAGFEADWKGEFFAPNLDVGLMWSSRHSRGQMARIIDMAKHRLCIQHPKFVDAVILDRIVSARGRGVKVKLLCGGKHGISDWDVYDTFSSLRIMESVGVQIKRQKALKLHAKLILVDDCYAQTGSMNIDRSAFDVRRELGIESDSPEVVARLISTFKADWQQAKHYTAPDPLDPKYHEHGELPHDPHFVHE